MAVFFSRPYRCRKCDEAFVIPSNLKKHKREHHKDEVVAPAVPPPEKSEFKCTLCDNVYPRQDRLDRHMRRHEDKIPLECDFCDYKAKDQYKIRRHLITHTGRSRVDVILT